MGDLAGARKMQEESLSAFRAVGNKRGAAATLDNLGNVLLEIGDLAGARKCYEEGIAIQDEIGYKRGKSFALASLGGVLVEQGDLENGRKVMEDALAIRQELGEQDLAAQSRVQMASLALERGRYADREALARQAIAQFDLNNSIANSAWANAVLARNLLAKGNISQARAAADRAASLSVQSIDRYPRFEATLAHARVLAATGSSSAAISLLESMLAEAKKYGYLSYLYEARLAMGEIETKARKSALANAELASLEKDAQASGFVRIAARAKKAQATS